MCTVLQHAQTVLSMFSRVEVMILSSVSFDRAYDSGTELTFNPFICLYRFLHPAPTAQMNGLDRSSASSTDKPRSPASCWAKSHCLLQRQLGGTHGFGSWLTLSADDISTHCSACTPCCIQDWDTSTACAC